MNVLAVIPARGGSKRIPDKNLKPLAGLPLVRWSIKAALASKLITRIVVSSDHPDVLREARALGVDALKSAPRFYEDGAPLDPTIIDAAITVRPPKGPWDWVVTLQPSSPIRPPGLVDECITKLVDNAHAKSLVTVHTPGHFVWFYHPSRNFSRYTWWEQHNCTRRCLSQDMLPSEIPWVENGAVFVTDGHTLIAEGKRVVPPVICHQMAAEHSRDINTDADFQIAEMLLERSLKGTVQ